MRKVRTPEEVQRSVEAAKKVIAKAKIETDKKSIKSARIALLILGCLQIILSLFYAFGPPNIIESLFVDGPLGLIFIGLYFYGAKNPRISFIVGITLYLATIVIVGINDPTTLYKGVILKAIIIYYLVIGIKASKNYVYQPVEDDRIIDQSFVEDIDEIR